MRGCSKMSKIKLIEDAKNLLVSQKDLALKYGLHQSTVSKIIKNKNEIQTAFTVIL